MLPHNTEVVIVTIDCCDGDVTTPDVYKSSNLGALESVNQVPGRSAGVCFGRDARALVMHDSRFEYISVIRFRRIDRLKSISFFVTKWRISIHDNTVA